MFGRRSRKAPVSSDGLLTQTIARHFPNATIDGQTVRLGVGDLAITCHVPGVDPTGGLQAARLYFEITGVVGDTPIFASVSGYGESRETAIVEGACQWACAFGPVLQAGVTGQPVPTAGAFPDAEEFETVLGGRRFRVVVAAMDRSMLFAPGPSPQERIAAARARFADRWLTAAVLDSGTLPVHAMASGALLSAFVLDIHDHRSVEVKINGADWPGCTGMFEHVAAEPFGGMTLLRELAMLVPVDVAAPSSGVDLTRDELTRTLAAFDPSTAGPSRAEGWPGWHHHKGALAVPLTGEELAAVERKTGPLPNDYRAFLTEVAAVGAGPGYGLEWPRRIGDAVLLAHAGCHVAWVLRLDGPERGQVWVDAVGSDKTYAKVADSFTEWYRAWSDAAVRQDGPWIQWNNLSCASADVLGQFAQNIADRSDWVGPVSLTDVVPPGCLAMVGGGVYLPDGSPLDPCHGCVDLAGRFGLPPETFARGLPSTPGAG
ncbi:SMI1/KNR4 family protein [Luedemannella flava]